MAIYLGNWAYIYIFDKDLILIKDMIKYYLGIIVLVVCFSTTKGQGGTDQVEYTPQLGLEYFKAGNYFEAEKVYDFLLGKYPKDSRYNFYMGICELKNRSDLSGAIKKLNYAKIKRISKDVYYYLGRAHQLSYNYEEAISNYKTFIKNASSSDARVDKANSFIEECNNGRKISNKIYQLEVLNKSKVHKNSILSKYAPVKDVGKLLRNGDFFESGVDPNNVMFETERGDVVYFSMKTNVEDTMSIYKMVKLIDGWGKSESVGEPVNSVYNDAYPFLATDGLTFYFASNRPGGMGGYDIYKAYYDNESHSFLEPINLGVPFNSPDDDFLFVSDEFSKVAWFASNREVRGDSVIVYNIKWDGRQVRNMVEDENQIKESAKLQITQNGDGNEDGYKYQSNNTNVVANNNKGAFSFEINDTIVYTQIEHFINDEARALYKEGFKLDEERDSLSYLLKKNRAKYSVVKSDDERNEVVNEILRLEGLVYSLEDKVQENYMYARQKEINEITDRIANGTYQTIKEVKPKTSEATNIEGIFIPEKYSMYTSDEFEKHYQKNAQMYESLFSENDIKVLRYADSLYVWANILNLESAQLLAKSTQQEEDNSLNLGKLIKRGDEASGEEKVSTSAAMIKESKELKILSTRIYHKALDKKYPVYWLKLKDISSKLDDNKGREINELTFQGNAYFREAKKALSTLGGLNIEDFEKAGAMKRAGIESQENALKLYNELISEGYQPKESVSKPVKSVVQKSYSELQKGSDAIVAPKKETAIPEKQKEEAQVLPAKTESTVALKEEYRIQIGVFRNAPNNESLSKIPEISKIELIGRGLTKYFSGHYKTKPEAEDAIDNVVRAGFAGAFVVYFKDGKITSLPKE